MKKKVITVLSFFFFFGVVYSQTSSSDTISAREIMKIQDIIKLNKETSATKKIEGNSAIGQFSGFYRITQKGAICEMQVKFRDSDIGVITFFYSSDTLMVVNIGEKQYYKINSLYLFNNKEMINGLFLQQLLSFEREQLSLIRVLED